MMQIAEGKTVDWQVASGAGRVVASFGTDEGAARRHIDKMRERQVQLRLFCVERDVVECEHP